MVVWLTGTYCSTYMGSEFTVIFPFYDPSRHSMMYDVICGCRTVFAIFSIVAYRIYMSIVYTEEAGSRRGIIDTRHRHQ